MLRATSQNQIDQWKNSLHAYEKNKRTKRPFGPQQPPTPRNTKSDVLEKQMRFNPVLQNFRDQRESSKTIEHEQIQRITDQMQHLKNNYKYNTHYDIVTCHPTIALPEEDKSKSLMFQNRKRLYKDPTYNAFNIINGRNYNQEYLEKKQMKTIRHPQRKIHPKINCSYDIISTKYQNSLEEKQQQQQTMAKSVILSKYQQTRTIDNITGKYYNPQKESQYHNNQKIQALNQSQQYLQKQPLSYKIRQPYVQQWNPTLTPVLQAIDQKAQNAKQRYSLRYAMEYQHKLRNDYLQQKRQRQTINRVHNARILQQKGKEFNIINSQRYRNSRAELFGKYITAHPYDVRDFHPSSIKQRGFDQF